MNARRLPLVAPLALAVLLGACAAGQTRPEIQNLQAELKALETDPELAARAPIAIAEAADAVARAESYSGDEERERMHLVYLADRRLAIARAEAQRELQRDQVRMLAEQRNELRLRARSSEAEMARGEADSARREAELARMEAEEARQRATAQASETEQLRMQLAELQAMNARPTDRGLVLTLDDVLFETNRAVLKAGNQSRLDRLADFLTRYEDRTAVIEGHTDSVGTETYNQDLSNRRAESVKAYLVGRGVDATRIRTVGRGENAPVASNDTRAGRQQNRRVEVIIDNPQDAARS